MNLEHGSWCPFLHITDGVYPSTMFEAIDAAVVIF